MTSAAHHDAISAGSAPLSGWRAAVTDTLLVGGATLVCHALGAATSLLLRWLLDPAWMGIWQGLKTFLSYGNYTNLGASKGATQELAMARGRGDLAAAQHGLNLAHTVNTLTAIVYVAVLWGVAAWVGLRNASEWSAAWAGGLFATGLLFFWQRNVTFQVTILRAKQQFAATSRLSIVEAAVTLAASAACIAMFGLPGMYLATAMVLLASYGFLRRIGLQPLSYAWDWPAVRRLVAIGGPILIAGVASSLFRSLDKLMILGYLDDREYQLGCYSLALMASTQLYGLANMLSTVMGPRYSELLGRWQSPSLVARLAARATEIQATALTLPAAVAIAAGPPLLGWLLPDYRAGLPALVWLIPGLLAAGLALPASQFLIATNQGRRVILALAVATLAAAVGNHWALTHDAGLVGVAKIMSLANVAYLAMLAAVSLFPQLAASERLRYLGVLAVTLLANVALVFATNVEITQAQPEPAIAILALLIVVAAWIAMSLAGWRYGGWSQAWRAGRS